MTATVFDVKNAWPIRCLVDGILNFLNGSIQIKSREKKGQNRQQTEHRMEGCLIWIWSTKLFMIVYFTCCGAPQPVLLIARGRPPSNCFLALGVVCRAYGILVVFFILRVTRFSRWKISVGSYKSSFFPWIFGRDQNDDH